MKRLLLLTLLLAGCTVTQSPQPNAGDADIPAAILKRLNAIDARLSALEDGGVPDPGPEPSPEPLPGGLPVIDTDAETDTRDGWIKYTETQIDVLQSVADDIDGGSIKDKSGMLAALNERARKGRNAAMTEASKNFMSSPIDTDASRVLRESAEGLRWNLMVLKKSMVRERNR